MASSRKSSGKPPAKKRKQIHGNTSRDHIHRLFLIFSEVQNKRYPSLAKLSKICEVDTRTIQRDIAQLNALLGNIEGEKQTNEIVHDKARRGYALRGNLKHLPIVQIGDRDLLTLHFLRQCLEPYRSTEIGRSMIESFEHTFGILTGTTDWKKWESSVHFRFEGKPEIGKEDVRLFELLHRAIRESRRVVLDYKPSVGPKDSRTLEPRFVFMRNGSWYLHATKAGTSERRTLKFARISNARITEATFVPDSREPSESFRYSFGIVASDRKPKQPVVLEFEAGAAQRASETLWHPEQKTTPLAGGRIRMELPFAKPTFLEIEPWILGWGATVKVIAPALLRKTIAEKARALASVYGE
ncbi:MAG: WYL domain-containing protein [Chthoniobacterales bacterium]